MTYVASYRVQMRGGMDFAALEKRLDQIAALGVSHLYLSPILTAAPGSTHGYDVTDPTTIDPSLGGIEGFEHLSARAQQMGLSIILDIVPNHMAFGLDTPWLRDVLRKGMRSPHAPKFDIDWSNGYLALPWLERPLAELAEGGDVEIEGDCLKVAGLEVPLSPGSGSECGPDEIEALHARQHWRLIPWPLERDSITHRRFFSVTGLIGVRVEEPAVFDETHALVFDLVDRGLVQGLRVDHVDGLVDPEAYLRRLADRLPGIDIWVEKILVTGETLPDWAVAGTTGYEAAAVIGRILTNKDGIDRIDALWRRESEIEEGFHPLVEQAKREVLVDELAAELRQLRTLAEAITELEGEPAGPETLREAITELLTAFPRYRSYVRSDASQTDRKLWREAADRAAENVRHRDTIDWLVDRMLASDSDEARAFTIRMEQVTGALLAKAHEDTAGFRFNRYLAANEVGADPDRPTTSADEIQKALAERLDHWPHALTIGSSHDTKRSADARARIVAISHEPEAMEVLWQRASGLPDSDKLDANLRFYGFQTALAVAGEPEAADRAADHMVKALREGKEVSYWTAPNEEREGRMQDWIRALIADWDSRQPAELARLLRIGAHLSLAEIALRCLWPGMPDIYQGEEAMLFQLTDPDNRRSPDWAQLARLPQGDDTPSDRKADLLRRLISLRSDDRDLFAEGTADWEDNRSSRHLVRRLGEREVRLTLTDDALPEDGLIWSTYSEELGQRLGLYARR